MDDDSGSIEQTVEDDPGNNIILMPLPSFKRFEVAVERPDGGANFLTVSPEWIQDRNAHQGDTLVYDLNGVETSGKIIHIRPIRENC